MLVSISSWSYREPFKDGTFDLLSFLDEVKRLGADGLEIFPRHLNQDDVAGHLQQVADKARRLGLSIASVIVGNNFTMPSATRRAEQVERMKLFITSAADAGIERLNTFTGYHSPGQDPVMEVYRAIDAYREVIPLAEERGMVLCIENHSTVATDADSLLSLIRAVGSNNLRTNPDFSNFVPDFYRRSDRAKEAIYTETQKVAPLAGNAHLKVRYFDEDGNHTDLDVPRLLDIMREAGYDGHMVLEYYGRDDPAPACKSGIELLRRLS